MVKRTTLKASKEVFNHILKAGGFRKVEKAKSKTGEAVYVNKHGEFLVVERVIADIYSIPYIEYYYMNTIGHRYRGCNNAGYPIVVLDKTYTIHRIVMETFHGKTPKGYEINHIDENKMNYDLSNLEFVTHKENMQKFYKNHPNHGKGKKFKGKYYASTHTYTDEDGNKRIMSLSEYIDFVRYTRGEAAAKEILRRRPDKAEYKIEKASKTAFDIESIHYKDALAKAIEIINAD